MSTNMTMDDTQEITITPRTKYTGAEIAGLDLSKYLSKHALDAIADTLHQWGVVLFRSQVLTEAQHIAFSRHFGELEVHVVSQYTLPEYREILVLSNILKDGAHTGLADAGQRWHSDAGYRREPDRASVLYAREVPTPHANGETAGDTMFASARAAYEALDPAMKKRLDGLKVVYSYTRAYAAKINEGSSSRKPLTEKQRGEVPDVIQPLIRTHPYTRKKIIYVNPAHTFEIVGMPQEEGQQLLNELYAHITKPEFVYRHKWKVGDVLMWDNCVVQHNAVGDYQLPQRRLMHSTRIKGTAPF
jgi:taurine dioxygenase